VDQFRGLILNGAHYFGVAVAGGADGDARVAVEEDVAVNVRHPHALAALGDELEVGARVGRRDPTRVVGDDLLSLRAGQRGLDLRPLRRGHRGHKIFSLSERRKGVTRI
jgi:hypothetical protein